MYAQVCITLHVENDGSDNDHGSSYFQYKRVFTGIIRNTTCNNGAYDTTNDTDKTGVPYLYTGIPLRYKDITSDGYNGRKHGKVTTKDNNQ